MSEKKQKKTGNKAAPIKVKNGGLSLGKKKTKTFLSEAKGKLCLAFDFGEYATKIVVAKVSKDKIDIKHMLVVENDERKSKIDSSNMKEWRVKIGRALAQNNINTSGNLGLCTVNSRNYISRQLEIPYAEENDRQGLVAYQMSQNLSLDMNEHLFQHKVLRRYETDGVKMCTVWAAAIPKSLCSNYFELMESLKLKPMIMDVNVNGMEHLFFFDKTLKEQTANGVVAVIDYGIRGTEIGIYNKGIYQEGFDIELGDGKLVSAAKNSLGIQAADIHNGNKMVVSSQTVYNILRQAGESDNARLFREAVEEWLSAVNDVVRRYHINNPANQLTHIFLYGGSPQMSWLKAYLGKHLNVSTTVIQSLDCCKIPDKYNQTGNAVSQFLNAISLLLIR